MSGPYENGFDAETLGRFDVRFFVSDQVSLIFEKWNSFGGIFQKPGFRLAAFASLLFSVKTIMRGPDMDSIFFHLVDHVMMDISHGCFGKNMITDAGLIGNNNVLIAS